MKFDFGILPLASFSCREEAERALSALSAGGLCTVEIALRTPYAAEAVRLARENFPHMTVGAGTVLNGEQARLIADMGAEFLVSPGLSEGVARVAREKNLPYFPGCVTPTEIMRALDLGISAVKFFPAEAYGGVKALRALSEPFGSVRFLPTGGISMETYAAYLALPQVIAVGGSFPLRGDIEKNCARIRSERGKL